MACYPDKSEEISEHAHILSTEHAHFCSFLHCKDVSFPPDFGELITVNKRFEGLRARQWQ